MNSTKINVIAAVCIAPLIIYAGYSQFSYLAEYIDSLKKPDWILVFPNGTKIEPKVDIKMCVVCEEKKAATNQLGYFAIEISLISLIISIKLLFTKKDKDTGSRSRTDETKGIPPEHGENNKIKKLEEQLDELRQRVLENDEIINQKIQQKVDEAIARISDPLRIGVKLLEPVKTHPKANTFARLRNRIRKLFGGKKSD